MPDDPLRFMHEENLRKEVEDWLRRYEFETLAMVDQGAFDLHSIPYWYWLQMRREIREQIYKHLQLIEYGAAFRTTESLKTPIEVAELVRTTNQAAGEMAEKHASRLVNQLREQVEYKKNQAESAGLALGLILLAMLEDDKRLQRWAIGVTTNAITQAEKATARVIQRYLDDQYRRFNEFDLIPRDGQLPDGAATTGVQPSAGTATEKPGQTGKPNPSTPEGPEATKPESDSTSGRDYKPGQIRLVAIWKVQTGPDGKPDGKVCPTCWPLHNKPDHQWPKKYQSGPQAHPNCRCYLDWEFWVDGKPIHRNN